VHLNIYQRSDKVNFLKSARPRRIASYKLSDILWKLKHVTVLCLICSGNLQASPQFHEIVFISV